MFSDDTVEASQLSLEVLFALLFRVASGSSSSLAESLRLFSQLSLETPLSESSSLAGGCAVATSFKRCVFPSEVMLRVRDDDELRTAGFKIGFVSCFTAVDFDVKFESGQMLGGRGGGKRRSRNVCSCH